MENELPSVTSTAIALASFAFATSITPGPNNFLLMASGARAGFRATVPHMLGITGGMAGLLALAYFGVGALVSAHPQLHDAMAWACVVYMIWLAIKLLRNREPLQSISDRPSSQAWGLRQAAAFQFINPKAWAMAVSGAATVLASGVGYTLGFVMLVCVFASINLPCVAVWAAWGSLIRRYLAQPRLKLIFDVAMALLVLATAWVMAPAIP